MRKQGKTKKANYFATNRRIFRWIGISIILVSVIIFFVFMLMLSYHSEVEKYLSGGGITAEVLLIGVLGILLLALFTFITALCTILLIKIIIPTSAFDSLLMREERTFLKELPNRLREDVINNGE